MNKLVDFNKVKDLYKQAINEAMNKIGMDVVEKSVNRAPLQTGNLRANIVYKQVSYNTILIQSSAKDESGFDYAYIMHEDLTLIHLNGEAKYIEKTINENAHKYKQLIADTIRKYFS